MQGADKLKKWTGVTPGVARKTRQRERAELRDAAIAAITERYPGEPRNQRRSMGIALGNREYRKAHGLPEPRQ